MENRKKEDKERRKREKIESARREEAERATKEELRLAKEGRAAKKQKKMKKQEEEKLKLKKAMRLHLVVCMGGLREEIKEEMRRNMEMFQTIVKGKQRAASPTQSPSGSQGSHTSGCAAGGIEEISQRAKNLSINEKRKRSPDRPIANSPPMEQPPKRTPRKSTTKPVKLASKLQATTAKITTRKKKQGAKTGSAGKAKFMVENMRQLADFHADDLKRLCRREELEYGNKMQAVINVAEKRAEEAYDEEIAESTPPAGSRDDTADSAESTIGLLGATGRIRWLKKYIAAWVKLYNKYGPEFMDKHRGVYTLCSPRCRASYIGQTSRDVNVRWKEHIVASVRDKRNTHLYRWWRTFGAESYVMLPVDEEATHNLIDLEQLYIKKWSSVLNVSGVSKKSRRKKKQRKGKNERQRARSGEPLSKHEGSAVEVIQFRTSEENEWHADALKVLDEAEQRKMRTLHLYSTGGNSWIKGWKRMRKTYGATTVEVEGQAKKLAKCRVDIEHGRTILIKHLRKWRPKSGPDKEALTRLLRNPSRIQDLGAVNTNVMFRWYKAAKDFQQKSTRSYLRRMLSRAIKEKTGWCMGADLIVKIRYKDRVKLAEVRKVVNDKIEALGLLECMAKRTRSKVRTVWERNQSVVEILHNQRAYARAAVSTCTCAGLPYPRVGEHVRFRLHEVPGIHPLLSNANNVPRAQHPSRRRMLCKEIEDAFGQWKNRGDVDVRVTEQEVEICMTGNGESGGDFLDIEVVKAAKKRFEGLVLTPLDRNPGETYIMCPYIYYEAMMENFVTNPGYEIVKAEEEEIKQAVQGAFKEEGLAKFARYDRQGTFGAAYLQPKHKDVERYRPICLSYSDPATRMGKCVAKALNHLLFQLPTT
ncbi:hypothetical protein CBR_g41717 [Chara braunii]|uniref:GIY-YIG domain-containing protein n=1 Tax=Chara braunii TaxID=69332 RepID=A0A388LWK9_CHABU|nr:hypothetical protein CBR_g41717 [Chara braunii]|eukprot:GBG86655.1 hypothetical protein CBR_g41717 [Chara braunii]